MPTIRPTHHCFDDALEYLNNRVLAEPTLAQGTRLLLVHGIALFPNDQPRAGEPFAHAWCEEDELVWDCGLLDDLGGPHATLNGQRAWFAVQRDEYYAHMRVLTTTVYTVRDACLQNLRTHHFGPWDRRIRAMVK